MDVEKYGNECKTTVICMDAYDKKIPVGIITNPYYSSGVPFEGAVDLLLKLQTLVDELQFPKPYTILRGFSNTSQYEHLPLETPQKGKLATFTIKIMFCKNSSWQGSVRWNEGDREEYFRSALELIFLINSILDVT